MTRPQIPKIWNTEYTCPSCQHRVPVQFVDPEAITEDDPVGGRDKWTQQEALKSAQNRLEKYGRRAMRLVRCPACRHRDEEAVRRAYLWAALPLLGVAPAAFLVAIIVGAQLWPGRSTVGLPGLGALLLTLLISALVVVRGQRKLLSEAASALHFGKTA